MNCKFEECSIINIYEQKITQKNLTVENGALIYLGKGVISNCEYYKCKVIREYDILSSFSSLFSKRGSSEAKPTFVQTLNLIYSNSANVECCRFLECQCEDLETNRTYYKYSDTKIHNYLINLVEGKEKNNIFERCVAPAKIGTARWESEA